MISVRKIIGDERKYCTHCDDRALYELNYLNPSIVQQSSCGVLCEQCMKQLKAAIIKATITKQPKPRKGILMKKDKKIPVDFM
jgi:hypothetical protein